MRFILDHDKANGWLASVIAYNESDDTQFDGSVPAGITAAFQAHNDDDGTITAGLISAAAKAGIITTQGIDAILSVEFNLGSPDDLYRYLVDITSPPLTLTGPTSQMNLISVRTEYGADNAMEVLCEAVDAANGMLGQLQRFMDAAGWTVARDRLIQRVEAEARRARNAGVQLLMDGNESDGLRFMRRASECTFIVDVLKDKP